MNNISAIILAAGNGTRLRPITYFKPKALVTVNNKPAIEYVIQNLNRANINQIYINLHHKPVAIMDYVKRCAFFYEPELLGTAGTIKALLPYQTENFVVSNADTITTLDIAKMMEWHKKSGRVATIAWRNDKCTGTMIFNKSIDKYLPPQGMIDDVISQLKINRYDSVDNKFWDIGTFEGLFRARREVK